MKTTDPNTTPQDDTPEVLDSLETPETNKQEASSKGSPLKEKKASTADIVKFAGLITFLLLIVGIGVALWPYMEHFSSESGRLELIAMIKDAGPAGVLICLGLQFIQIVVAFIPGEITQLAIGAIYGPFFGSLITALGALVSSIFIFFVVRKLGAPFVHDMIGSKHNKVLDFLHKDSNLNAIVFILYLIPGLPKDIFTYLFPLTDVKPVNFFVLSTLGRLLGIVASAFIGSAIVQGDYTQAIIVGVIAGGLGLLGIIFNKKIIAVIDKVERRLRKNKEESA